MNPTEQITKSLAEFGDNLKSNRAEIVALQKEVDELAKKVGRPRAGPEQSEAVEHRKAFARFLKTGEKSMSIASDENGGYSVPDELDREIAKVALQHSAMRGLANVVRANSGAYERIVSISAAGAEWVSESGTRSETATPQLGSVRPSGGGLSAVAPVTNWLLLDSAFNLEQFIAEELGRAFGVSEGAAFISGTGVNQPKGILEYALAAQADGARPFGTIEKMHSGAAGDFDADDLVSLFFKLKAAYRSNASWLMSGPTLEKVRKMKTSGSGDYLFRLDAGGAPTLLGRPIIEDDNVPAPGAASNSVILADFRAAYTIVDVGSPVLIRDNVTSKGKTLFYTERRVLGAALDTNAAKVLHLAV